MLVPDTMFDSPTISADETDRRLRWVEDAQRTILCAINEVSGSEEDVIQMLRDLLDRLEGP